MELTEGIVLKSIPYQDHAKIVFLLTKEGKVSFILKGGTSLKSHTYMYNQELTKIRFATKKNYFTGGEVIMSYPAIKGDFNRLTCALQILELADVLSTHATDLVTFYTFTASILELLETGRSPTLLLIIYKLKNLYLLGVAPSFTRCVDCGGQANLSFVVAAGGMKCTSCLTPQDQVSSPKLVDDLRRLYITKLGDFDWDTLRLETSEASIEAVLKTFYEQFLGFISKTKPIMQQLL